jgi:hypothetical protein
VSVVVSQAGGSVENFKRPPDRTTTRGGSRNSKLQR